MFVPMSLFCAFFCKSSNPNPLPGSFSTHDVERVYHCILTDSHCILLTGAPLENSILFHVCDFLLPPPWFMFQEDRPGGSLVWSILDYPALSQPPSSLVVLSSLDPHTYPQTIQKEFQGALKAVSMQQQMQTTIQLPLHHEFSNLHIHLFQHTSFILFIHQG